jgi:hypothetical protein
MSLPNYISQSDAARCAGVQRRTIYNWLQANRLKLDGQGRILREPFERERAPHVTVSRLRQTLAELPAHQVPFILIEVLGADYVRALGNIAAGQSNKTVEGKMSGDVQS